MMSQNKEGLGLSVDIATELSKNITIHKNVKQEIIVTTEDKIRLVLIDTKRILTAQRDWWTPLGLLLSFIATICTADFKDSIGLTKDTWQAIFLILILLCAIWLIKTLLNLYENWGKHDLQEIVKRIKLNE